MNENIYWLLEVAIRPGQLENFRALAKDLIAATNPDPNALNYEWNLTDDGTVCHIYERYRHSAAVMAHIQVFMPFAERFGQICEVTRCHIYGKPSPEVKATLADLNPVYLAPLGGFSR